MKCFNCKIEIPATFEFALSQNKCPACGEEILDEETRALKGDIIEYVGSSITLRPETLEKLSMMLITRYNIQGISSNVPYKRTTNTRKALIQEVSEEVGEEVEEEIYDAEEEIKKLQEKRDREIENKELDELKGEALKEALKAKYNLSFGEEDAPSRGLSASISSTDFDETELPNAIRQRIEVEEATKLSASDMATATSNADFGDINPILEAARLKNKVKTARAMEGGGDASFRRTV